jgi:hypothetical protein
MKPTTWRRLTTSAWPRSPSSVSPLSCRPLDSLVRAAPSIETSSPGMPAGSKARNLLTLVAGRHVWQGIRRTRIGARIVDGPSTPQARVRFEVFSAAVWAGLDRRI